MTFRSHRTCGAHLRRVVTVAAAVCGLSALAHAGDAAAVQGRQNPEAAFTAFAVDIEHGLRTGTLEIVIERWSTPEESRTLRAALDEGRQEGLLRALHRVKPVGYFRSTGALRYDLRFASETPREDGGRRILVVTDRPVTFAEAWERPQRMDYPFMVAELQLGPDDTGEGRLSAATQIRIVGDRMILDRFEVQPVRLQEVRPRG